MFGDNGLGLALRRFLFRLFDMKPEPSSPPKGAPAAPAMAPPPPSGLHGVERTPLCVVGNLNRDLKTAPVRAGEHLFQDGETSVESVVETIGGGGANSACVAAALGASVTLLAKVGADALGARLEQTLVQHGVRPRLARDPAVATGTSLGLAFDNGHRHFLSCLRNNEALRFEDLDLDALEEGAHLYRADLWFSRPMLFGGNQRLFREARARHLTVSLDLNWDPRWGVGEPDEIRQRKQAVREVLPLVHLAHGNARELQAFAEAPDLDTALRRLEAWGVEAVAVHLGAQGAGYYQGGKLWIEPPVPAARQVNTTGTGDVLSVCLMLSHGSSDVTGRLRQANRIVTEFIEGRRQFIPAVRA
jgi:sugar/nucleoside kinase (ribokinase family)